MDKHKINQANYVCLIENHCKLITLSYNIKRYLFSKQKNIKSLQLHLMTLLVDQLATLLQFTAIWVVQSTAAAYVDGCHFSFSLVVHCL